MTDPIADFIIRLKNAFQSGRQEVEVPHSKIKEALAKILVDEGYLTEMKVDKSGKFPKLVLGLKYVGKQPALSGVKRLSKPGRRLYSSVSDLPKTLGGYGITILSSNQGLLTDAQARKQQVGGELICQIW